MDVIWDWLKRYFSDPQVVILSFLLITGFLGLWLFGEMLVPVLASVILAYLLEGLVRKLESRGMKRILAVTLVCVGFVLFFVFVLLGLLPLLSRQTAQFFQLLPEMIGQGKQSLLLLPEKYPEFISASQVTRLMDGITSEFTELGQSVVSLSLTSLVGLITLMVYLILVPLLVFFFLKDKHQIIGWFTSYLPRDRRLAAEVWNDVDIQIGNYVRGKFVEILIIFTVSYITFTAFGLNFAVLLSVLVGISVIVPYIGATVATLPVAVVAYFQWGVTGDFWYVMVAYGIIQALDGNVLVPLLFSEVVDLHPIAIIVAVLVFGGIWGFWGVFFAIPLATLVQAVLKAMPRPEVAAQESN